MNNREGNIQTGPDRAAFKELREYEELKDMAKKRGKNSPSLFLHNRFLGRLFCIDLKNSRANRPPIW